jgi:AAA15 family ATPase/GTPase
MAVQLNSEALRPIFDWFANQLIVFNEQTPLNYKDIIDKLQQADGKEEVFHFMNAADISIADIRVETRKVPGKTFQVDFANDKTEIRNEEMEEHQFFFHHTTELGEATLGWSDESHGTRNLLFLYGPIDKFLKSGATLIIDELDTSLHTLLVRAVVSLFHQPSRNINGAQLIFTTHDTSLLDAYGLFRRDQIWFIEKDQQQASSLIALSEFSPRKNEALERGYLQGRYGAIPLLDELREHHKNGS